MLAPPLGSLTLYDSEFYNPDMSVLFLFGAGASNGGLDCFPYPPPLGRGLFDELQKTGGIASTIGGKLADLFRHDFEAGMDEFLSQRQNDVLRFIREMSLYFVRFIAGSDNLYTKLLKSPHFAEHGVVFATTNYELLIESAANKNLGLGIKYDNRRPFSNNVLSVLKLHGSVNFLPDLWGNVFLNLNIKGFNTKSTVLETPIKISSSIKEIQQFCQSESSFAPAVAMYASSKWLPIGRNFIEQQQEYWQIEVSGASHIFIIGAGVHERDSHVWEPLAKSSGSLTYVDPFPGEFIKWAKKNNRANVDIIALPFEHAISLIEKQLD